MTTFIQHSTGQRLSEFQVRQIKQGLLFGPESDITGEGFSRLEFTDAPQSPKGMQVVEGPDEEYEPFKWRQSWLVGPTDPSERTAAIKEWRRNEINKTRDDLELQGFPYMGKWFDSDQRSANRIFGAVQAAQAAAAVGAPFEVNWTTADGSVVTLDAMGTMGVPVAMATQANALHQYAAALKILVEDAETEAEIEAIDIESGWPSQED